MVPRVIRMPIVLCLVSCVIRQKNININTVHSLSNNYVDSLDFSLISKVRVFCTHHNNIMPGGITCSVMSCKNNSTTARKMGKPLGFFTFPKDLNIRKEWVNRCNRKEDWNPGSNSSRICSDHFEISDFEDVVKARMLNVNPKRLKSDGKCLGISPYFFTYFGDHWSPVNILQIPYFY